MKAAKVYVRFYRAFNYDYLRKTHPEAKPSPWDYRPDGAFYPFVRVGLDSLITTVVGGNEAGKSQLLSAIKAALTGRAIERRDFCRYSQFFVVDRSMEYPEFGIRFANLLDQERVELLNLLGLDESVEFSDFALFRFSDREPRVFLDTKSDGWQDAEVPDQERLAQLLPVHFEIDAATPLPDSIPIRYLANESLAPMQSARRRRLSVADYFDRHADLWSTPSEVESRAVEIHEAYSEGATGDRAGGSEPVVRSQDKMLVLADDLLTQVAEIDRSTFSELHLAVRSGNEGFANGIVERINRKLATALNFRRHWSQDHRFELRVSLRDFDLVFTIRDRTGTEYSFGERSGGLKYFLSYFVQYLAHRPASGGRQEILLMDEPDAYLSSSGQQDLLKIFEAFSNPGPGRSACQVVYVTHSPFLIDKNHSERIRVLEKGEDDEGTRVVANASKNHYEPLRSALGSFVAETTFISNCNLMLEGPSDQVLLAGLAASRRRGGALASETLDLNTLTLVPAGSASHIPYLVHLARGRDVDVPAVVVLLDSDAAGNEAKKALLQAKKRARLEERHILQVGDLDQTVIKSSNPNGLLIIEDLVPVPVGIAAAAKYVAEVLGAEQGLAVSKIKATAVKVAAQGLHAALEGGVQRTLADESFHLDKIGLARSVVEVFEESPESLRQSLEILDQNFKALFREIASHQRVALRELDMERTSKKIRRLRDGFFADNPVAASREQAMLLLEDIGAALGSGPDAEELGIDIIGIKRTHSLESDQLELVSDFARFSADVHALAYARVRAVQTADP